jgi:hypothetical protein
LEDAAEEMTRAIILALTAFALICLWLDQPKPIKSVQVDYCLVDMKVAAPDQFGVWHKFWAKGYGPCSDLDRYENI